MTSDFESFHFFLFCEISCTKTESCPNYGIVQGKGRVGPFTKTMLMFLATFSIIEVFLSISFLWGLKNF